MMKLKDDCHPWHREGDLYYYPPDPPLQEPYQISQQLCVVPPNLRALRHLLIHQIPIPAWLAQLAKLLQATV